MKKTLLRSMLAAAPLSAILGLGTTAHAGLSFTTTYEPGFNATAQTTINNVLANYSALFTDNVNVSLKFSNANTGLGSSLTYSFSGSYALFLSVLQSDATSAHDAMALANLPGGPLNPVTGTPLISLTRPGWAALGVPVNVSGIANYFDGEIDLNLSLMNLDRLGSPNPAKYDLQAIVQHEINEVLGTISNVGRSNTPRPVDLFRYTLAGNRTYTTAGDDAYFSIDGGATKLARYNQNSQGDYGDFWSATGTQNPKQVQDAFATQGLAGQVNLGAEIEILDVVGYDVAVSGVPETSTYLGGALLLIPAGLRSLRSFRSRRQSS